MSYTVTFDRRGERDYDDLPQSVMSRIAAALRGLVEDPRPPGVKALTGKLKGRLRVRVGDWRIVYRVDDTARTVVITNIGRRNEVYDQAERGA